MFENGIHKFEFMINSLCYRNKMNINSVLNYSDENDTQFKLHPKILYSVQVTSKIEGMMTQAIYSESLDYVQVQK